MCSNLWSLWVILLLAGTPRPVTAIPAPLPARIAKEYALISAYARENYPDPKNWRLLGSNDGGKTWDVLDVQSNQTFRARSQRKVYRIANSEAYNIYRLEVQDVSAVQLSELELSGPLVGVTNESDLQIVASSSKDHPLLGPAYEAFDNDSSTRWLDFGNGQNICWLQCRYAQRSPTILTNVSQFVLISHRLAAHNPLSERVPQILSVFTNQSMRTLRTLRGYALTSANDSANRDPRDWRLLGSNDRGETWNLLDVRQNEIFPQRFQRRVFALTNEAPYALYRLQIDCVRVPANIAGGANSVQLAEIEPLYSITDKAGPCGILVSAEGENPPLETVEAAFDGKSSSKWLSFTEDGNSNRSSWVQWEYLQGIEPGVMNLRWIKALQAQKPTPLQLGLEGMVVSWDPDSNVLGFLDETGFEQFKLRSAAKQAQAGQRVRLTGRIELGQELPLVSDAELICLQPAARPQAVAVGQSMPAGQSFITGAVDARITSVSEESGKWTTLGLVSEDGSGRMQAKVHNSSGPIRFLRGCHVRLEGVVQALLQQSGEPGAGVIWVAGPQQVSFVARTEKEWGEWPAYSLERLTRTNARVRIGSPVRVVGTQAQQDSESIVLGEKGTNLVRVYSKGSEAFSTGQRIEAIGILDREGGMPTVRLAQVRPAAQVQPTPATVISKESEPQQPTVTRVREVYSRLEEQPGKPFPVCLRGVITYIDRTFDTFCLQDGADGIFIENQVESGLAPFLRQEGSYVEVRGQVDPAQQAIKPDGFVTLLGKGLMPEPRRHSWDYLITGKDDGQWVQIEGMVSACGDAGLTLIVTGGRVAVTVNEFDKQAQDRLLGSWVRISGVCAPMRDNRNRKIGIQLLAPSDEFIETIRPAPEDPFDLATRNIPELAEQASPGSTNLTVRLVKTTGVVTYQEPRVLFIQDGADGLRIFLRGESTVRSGDRVEAVGFAEPDGFSIKLVQAVVRRIGTEPLPAAQPMDLMSADVSDQDATRVQIEATLTGTSSRKSVQILELNDEKNDKTFSAFVPVQADALPAIPVGSRVRLTGVFRAEAETMADLGLVPTAFQMYLNSPLDITVLHQPTWWNARHTLWVSAGLAAILLIALTWASSLRGKVLQRTQELHVEILEHKRTEEALKTSERFMRSLVESLPQNILRKDLNGRFTFANEFFCRTIGKSMDQIIGKTDFDLFPHELALKFREDDSQVIATGKLLETVEENRNAGGENIFVQVTKTPLFDANNLAIGIQVIFWDVTERKRAEARLAAAQKAMVESSRQAGMAEVAAGVLHNVGNVLNSVNVSASLLCDNLQKSKASGLGKVVSLLEEHEADLGGFFSKDPRSKQLTVYLAKLAERLNAEQTSAMNELQGLRKNIEHIKEIVAMQQNYAKVVGVTEKVHVTDLVEDALRLNSGSLEKHEIELTRQYEPHLPEIVVERHKVLQILVNLIRNAKYACDESGRDDKRLVVRVAKGDGCVTICASDNGVGISAENLNRIFNHGFTTRKDGHGFGLHSGALAAKEMGGMLKASSEGAGKGASFTLSLPLEPTSAELTDAGSHNPHSKGPHR